MLNKWKKALLKHKANKNQTTDDKILRITIKQGRKIIEQKQEYWQTEWCSNISNKLFFSIQQT